MGSEITRVAKAIAEEYFGRLETRSKIHNEWCERLARVAIEAIREPTEAMWGGLARDIVMWNRMPDKTGAALHRHLKMLGREIPDWLRHEIRDVDHVPPKGTVAACIFKAMIGEILK